MIVIKSPQSEVNEFISIRSLRRGRGGRGGSLRKGFNPKHIGDVCSGKRNLTGGYRWDYV